MGRYSLGSNPNIWPGPGDLADAPPEGWFEEEDEIDDDPTEVQIEDYLNRSVKDYEQ